MVGPIGALLGGLLVGGAQGAVNRHLKNRQEEANSVVDMAKSFASMGNTAGIEANKSSIIEYQGKDAYERFKNEALARQQFYQSLIQGGYLGLGQGDTGEQPKEVAEDVQAEGMEMSLGEPSPTPSTGLPPKRFRGTAQVEQPTQITQPKFQVSRITPGSKTPISFERVEAENVQMISDINNLYEGYLKQEMSPEAAWDSSLGQIIEKYNALPSPERLKSIKPDIEQDYEKSFNLGMSILTADENTIGFLTPEQQKRALNFQRKIRLQHPNLSKKALKNLITTVAAQGLAIQLGGYVPENFEDIVYGTADLPVSDKVSETAYILFGKTRGELNSKEILAAKRAASLFDIKEETTKAAEREKAVTKVKNALEPQKAISAEDYAKYGIPTKLKTYADVVNAGFRFMSSQDQQLFDRISATKKVVGLLTDLALGETDEKGNITKNGIFVGVKQGLLGSLISRGRYNAEYLLGTDLGEDVRLYKDYIDSIPRILLPLVGEQGGRFTDTDMKQIQRMIPKIGDSEKIARKKLEELAEFLQAKLDLILKPQLIDMRKPRKQTGAEVGAEIKIEESSGQGVDFDITW